MKASTAFSGVGHVVAIAFFSLIGLSTFFLQTSAEGARALFIGLEHDLCVVMISWGLASLFLEGCGTAIAQIPALTWVRGVYATAATIAAGFFLFIMWIDTTRGHTHFIQMLFGLATVLLMGGELWRAISARATHVFESVDEGIKNSTKLGG